MVYHPFLWSTIPSYGSPYCTMKSLNFLGKIICICRQNHSICSTKSINFYTVKRTSALDLNVMYYNFLFFLNIFSGITSKTYERRSSILMKLIPESQCRTFGGIITVKCDMTAADLVSLLLPDNTLAECNATCGTCGFMSSSQIKTISIQDTDVKKGLEDAVNDVICSKTSRCVKQCSGYCKTDAKIQSKLKKYMKLMKKLYEKNY